jgi:RHS repeat-associated protein
VNGGLAERKGEYFRKELQVGNASGPVWTNVTVASGGTTNTGGLIIPDDRQALVYDADGNLTFDGTWTYQWDAENRLRAMTMTNVANIVASNRLKLEFVYDYMNRRVEKVVSAWDGSTFVPQSTNRFVYDGWNLLGILDSGNSMLESFTWGQDLSGTMQDAGGIGGLLLVTSHSAPGTNAFAAYDGNGNVTALVQGGSDPIAARYEYSAFGETLRVTGPLAKINPFRFSTKFADGESGLVYFGYRHYAPSLGIWINRDPDEEAHGNNLYCLNKNDSVGLYDPLGLFWTMGHNRIIDTVFDFLSKSDRIMLKAGSRVVDKVYSEVEYSYRHAMTPGLPGWTKERAIHEASDFVWDQLYAAIDAAQGGNRWRGLFELGMGMHTMMDSMCPEHEDFQVWHGFNGWSGVAASAGHGMKEFFHSIPSYIDNLSGDKTDPLIGYYNMFDLFSE